MTGRQTGKPAGMPIRGDGQVTGKPRRRNVAAGIWTIVDVKTGEVISRFRARRRADVDRYLKMAEIGLRRPASDFEAVFVTEWDGD